ncbi:MAG: A/G-specific adenine glycosylase [Dehalococcoidia bacterium]
MPVDATIALPETDELRSLRRALLAWHRRHGLEAPWRVSRDPYQALVAAVMAQQTQMSRVLPKFDEFIEAFPTVEALAAASAGEVLRIWAPLGYNLRAVRLHRAAQQIATTGGFPRTAAELERIDGIGPFTAAIVTSFSFGERVAAIDTNVSRVIARAFAGDIEGGVPERALRSAADALVSRRAAGRWNQGIMDLGALVCTARAPRCDACPLARWCRARPRFAVNGNRRIAERRAAYRAEPPFKGSRRYYRGRIVQALRELPPGATVSLANVLARLRQAEACRSGVSGGLDVSGLRVLVGALERDGLVRVDGRGRIGLP